MVTAAQSGGFAVSTQSFQSIHRRNENAAQSGLESPRESRPHNEPPGNGRAQRMDEFISSGQPIPPPITNPTDGPGESQPPQEGSAFQGDYQIQAYIEVIRQFAKDDEEFERIVSQIEKFASGEWMQTGTEGTSQEAFSFSFTGNASTQITINVDMQRFREGAELEVIRQEDGRILIQEKATVQQADPLILDLNGNGIEVTPWQDGVRFDIDGDGKQDQTAFVTGGDAFLALDRNQNGRIDGGHELFGDQHGAVDGFAELRKFDENGDDVIDSADPIYGALRLFSDRNRDGVSQRGELRTLAEENIAAILLDATQTRQSLQGNTLTALSAYRRQDGTMGQIGDVFLNFVG